MRITLVHPPLDDPTLPYHSTAYLAGHLIANGFTDVGTRDLNVEFVNWCLREDSYATFTAMAESQLSTLEGRERMGYIEQEQYYNLWALPEITYEDLSKAVRGMRDMEVFLDWPEYKDNVNILLRYFGFLGALSYPSEIVNFKPQGRGRYSIYHLRDLFDRDLTASTCNPFQRFLDAEIADDAEIRDTDCFGISAVYDHQLHHTLHLARWFRERWPEKTLLLGGTAISQLYKYLKDKNELRRFFALCDGLVAGEGETAICQIAERGGAIEPGCEVQNLVTYNAARDKVFLPRFIHYENVKELGTPHYDHPWDLYLAPERGINYAPTRGCYWNKCTFCDYGLNTSMPTSPWRERTVDQVVEDLAGAVEDHGLRYVYFAVDVMSPKYLDRLSDAILEHGLDIRWSAELRMEKVFSEEKCRKLARSGCVCVSFGMESGSQRVLDLIDKGTKIEYMGKTMENFAAADIAVQLMAFTDFPGETPDEKAESYRFVEEHKEHWSAGGMGVFLLTGTAIVAKDPARFGVELVDTEDADIARALAFRLKDEEDEEAQKANRRGKIPKSQMLTEDYDASFDESGNIFPNVYGRPWAGGTDALHTMIYYDTYGRHFFRENSLRGGAPPKLPAEDEMLDHTIFLPGVVKASPFDIGGIIAGRQSFAQQLSTLNAIPKEPTRHTFSAWAEQQPPLERNPVGDTFWIRAGDKCIRLEKLPYLLLRAAVDHDLTVGELLSSFEGERRDRLFEFLRALARKGFIELNPPPGSPSAGAGWAARRAADAGPIAASAG